jgi:hypothetical protein
VFSTIGVSVISHYCGGELEKVSLFSKPTSCCGEEEETDMEDGCCKNETTHISFQQDFTFYTLVADCKATVNQLFIVEPGSVNFSKQIIAEFGRLVNKKTHPPNLVQHDIVSTSVILI